MAMYVVARARSLVPRLLPLQVVSSSRLLPIPAPSTWPIPPLQARFFALSSPTHGSKKRNQKASRTEYPSEEELDEDDPGAVPIIQTQGKHRPGKAGPFSKKGQKGQTVGDASLPGEKFVLKTLEDRMQKEVDRAREGVRKIMFRVERVGPEILDVVKVEYEGDKQPLSGFANVRTEGRTLVIEVYDAEYRKAVETAILNTDLGIGSAPIKVNDTTLRLAVPPPTLETRKNLSRQLSALSEGCRNGVRLIRQDGQKAIKHDIDEKIVGQSEGFSAGKKLDEATKKRTREIDEVHDKANKIVLDER